MTYTHPHALIRHYTAGIQASRATYLRENHCHCGAFVPFSHMGRQAQVCDECREVAA